MRLREIHVEVEVDVEIEPGEKMSGRTIRFKELKNKISVSRATIWRWEKAGKFPKSIRLTQHITVWRENEIDRWIDEQAKKN